MGALELSPQRLLFADVGVQEGSQRFQALPTTSCGPSKGRATSTGPLGAPSSSGPHGQPARRCRRPAAVPHSPCGSPHPGSPTTTSTCWALSFDALRRARTGGSTHPLAAWPVISYRSAPASGSRRSTAVSTPTACLRPLLGTRPWSVKIIHLEVAGHGAGVTVLPGTRADRGGRLCCRSSDASGRAVLRVLLSAPCGASYDPSRIGDLGRRDGCWACWSGSRLCHPGKEPAAPAR